MEIKIRNVTKKIKDAIVLDCINMELKSGTVYGLQGKNGSGKTMLLRLLCGFILPSEGEVQPIVGYNYGAKQYERVRKTLRYGITAGVVVTTVGFVLSELFPHAIVAMFTTSEELVDLSVTGLRISCAMFPFVGCQIVISNFFQSIGRAPVSIFLSLSRQLLFLLPLLLILPTYWSTNGVWLSMPISDFIAFVIAVMALWIHQRKIRQKFQTVQS